MGRRHLASRDRAGLISASAQLHARLGEVPGGSVFVARFVGLPGRGAGGEAAGLVGAGFARALGALEGLPLHLAAAGLGQPEPTARRPIRKREQPQREAPSGLRIRRVTRKGALAHHTDNEPLPRPSIWGKCARRGKRLVPAS